MKNKWKLSTVRKFFKSHAISMVQCFFKTKKKKNEEVEKQQKERKRNPNSNAMHWVSKRSRDENSISGQNTFLDSEPCIKKERYNNASKQGKGQTKPQETLHTPPKLNNANKTKGRRTRISSNQGGSWPFWSYVPKRPQEHAKINLCKFVINTWSLANNTVGTS